MPTGTPCLRDLTSSRPLERISASLSVLFLAIYSALSLISRVAAGVGVRAFEEPISTTVLLLVSVQLQPAAVVGLGLLFVYITVDELDRENSAFGDGNMSGISLALWVFLPTFYVLFALALWVDPVAVATAIHGAILRTSRFVYTSPLVEYVDPVTVRSVETDLRTAVSSLERTLQRGPGRPVRWPFYLFVSYVALSELFAVNGWVDVSTRIVRIPGQLAVAIFVVLYGLILSHNFFPGRNAIPWNSTTITVWLLAHTVVAAIILFVLRRVIIPNQTDAHPSLPGTITIVLLFGTVVALLDGLSPLPELLVLGVAILVLLGRVSSTRWATERAITYADIEGRVIDALSMAWTNPGHLFALLLIVQGFWWGGHLLWLLVFSSGGVLTIVSGLPPTGTLIVALVFLPLVSACVFTMWFWFRELVRRSGSSQLATSVPHRFPDLLVAPTTVIASYLVAARAFDVHVLAIVVPVAGVIAGTTGMWLSMRGARSGWALPRRVSRHAIPIAFLVQAGGLELAMHVADNRTAAGGSPALVLLGTLVPLYYVPGLREDGVRTLSSRPSFTLLVGVVVVFVTAYGLDGSAAETLNSAFLGIAAVALAVSVVVSDVRE